MNQIEGLKNHELLENFKTLVRQEKESTAAVVTYLAQIDKRKLFAQEGYSSLFNYLTQKYHYSESAAYRRIQAVRLSVQFPEVIEYLRDGRLNLETMSLMAPHLTPENKDHLLSQVFKKSSREVEYVVASFLPQKQKVMRDKIKILPWIQKESRGETLAVGVKLDQNDLFKTAQNFSSGAGGKNLCNDRPSLNLSQSNPKRDLLGENSSEISGIVLNHPGSNEMAPEKNVRLVKIEFCAKESLVGKIERAKQILRRKFPQGKMEDIFEEALELLLEKKDPERKIKRIEEKKSKNSQKKEETKKVIKNTTPSRRHAIPQHTKLNVYQRDGRECSFVSPDRKICRESGFLEIDHVVPLAQGGTDDIKNLRLLCSTHNKWRAEKTFGKYIRSNR